MLCFYLFYRSLSEKRSKADVCVAARSEHEHPANWTTPLALSDGSGSSFGNLTCPSKQRAEHILKQHLNKLSKIAAL